MRLLIFHVVLYVIIFSVGVMFIAPSGPGSNRIVYIIMLLYAFTVAVLSKSLARKLNIFIGLFCLIGIFYETWSKQKFHEEMKVIWVERKAEGEGRRVSAENQAID